MSIKRGEHSSENAAGGAVTQHHKVKKSLRSDPLYAGMAPPEIFKSQDNPQLSRELLNAIISVTHEHGYDSKTSAPQSEKIDHARIEEKLQEIEKMLLDPNGGLQTVKSAALSQSDDLETLEENASVDSAQQFGNDYDCCSKPSIFFFSVKT